MVIVEGEIDEKKKRSRVRLVPLPVAEVYDNLRVGEKEPETDATFLSERDGLKSKQQC